MAKLTPLTGNLDQYCAKLLPLLQRSWGISQHDIVRRAFEYWAGNPSLNPVASKKAIAVTFVFPVDLHNQILAYATEHQVSPIQIIEAALTQWFEEIGGKLLHVSSKLSAMPYAPGKKKKKPKPKPKPVAEVAHDEEDLSATEILRQQIRFYQRQGNALKVGQLSRKLQELEAAA